MNREYLNARDRRWKHNSFFGHVRMAEMNMRSIAISETTTIAAKAKADKIIAELNELRTLLGESIDA